MRDVEAPEVPERGEMRAVPAGAKSRGTILTVDDDPAVRALVERILIRAGYRVLTAEGGATCLAAVERNGVDLVLLDLEMPDANGISLLETIHALKKDLPVVIVTGYGDPDTARQAMELGAYDYVAKPVMTNVILEVVREALSTRCDG
ncbi:MAG: response regulator [Planctomycetes bacterium]|nr:response regulator [Planctomycetota bacterium]